MSRHIEVVMKPTLQCNGICEYCNAVERTSFMDVQVVRRTFEGLADHLAGHPDAGASILWHGGEPMLMGADFYRSVIELDRNLFSSRPMHIMQSNLTVTSEDLVGTLEQLLNGGGVGTSLDPFENYRKLKDGSSYFERWYTGFETMKSHGFNVGMVYVVHGRSLDRCKDLYYYFKNLGVDSLTVIPLEEPSRDFAGPRLDSLGWGRFLLEMFQVWQADDCSLPLEPFSSWESLLGDDTDRQRSFHEALSCCEPTLAIGPEGDVYSCVRRLDIGSGPIGNVLTHTMEEILSHPESRWRSDRSAILKTQECGACRWWGLCAGGCAAASGFRCKTVWCEGNKHFFEEAYA
jgi:uncharacterized protein